MSSLVSPAARVPSWQVAEPPGGQAAARQRGDRDQVRVPDRVLDDHVGGGVRAVVDHEHRVPEHPIWQHLIRRELGDGEQGPLVRQHVGLHALVGRFLRHPGTVAPRGGAVGDLRARRGIRGHDHRERQGLGLVDGEVAEDADDDAAAQRAVRGQRDDGQRGRVHRVGDDHAVRGVRALVGDVDGIRHGSAWARHGGPVLADLDHGGPAGEQADERVHARLVVVQVRVLRAGVVLRAVRDHDPVHASDDLDGDRVEMALADRQRARRRRSPSHQPRCTRRAPRSR